MTLFLMVVRAKLYFFKCRECNSSSLNARIGGHIVDVTDSVTHLGHTISSRDRDRIAKSANTSFWKSFKICMSDFGKLSCLIKNKMFDQYCCSFFGSPLWSLKGAGVQSVCTDWRTALISLWRVSPRTHCDLIITLSNHLLLFIALKKRFISFIDKCLASSNSIVKCISHFAIHSPMSSTGHTFRDSVNSHGMLSIDELYKNWTIISDNLKCDVNTLYELIDIRDGYSECVGFTLDDINSFIFDICTH